MRLCLDLVFGRSTTATKNPRIRISTAGDSGVSAKKDLTSHINATMTMILRRVPFLNILYRTSQVNSKPGSKPGLILHWFTTRGQARLTLV
ncbi:MAG: hypothetical protein GX797_09025 [Chloroflexi bacterium]|nr:hypothetical protein [Chloroflexota bacterium]